MKKLIKLMSMTLASLALTQSLYAKNLLQIKGSDTLVNFVQTLSEEYMKKHPNQPIAVTGGGSGTGIAALINKKCDIANASRTMKPKEIARAVQNGVKISRVVIAMDGLSVIIHQKNRVNKLDLNQLSKIFQGTVKNWKELGGADMPINLYGRQSNSGTFVFFRDQVVKGDYSQRMKRMNGNAQIVESIKHDKSGIGYVGVGYVKNANRIAAVKVAPQSGGYYASPLNDTDVKSGKYPIVRPLNQYISGELTQKIKAFIQYELSSEGQQIVKKEGFFPIPSEYIEYNQKIIR